MRQRNVFLKKTIFEQQLTQKEVAKRAKMSEVTISLICTGKYIPDADEEERIAEVLGVNAGQIFRRNENTTEKG